MSEPISNAELFDRLTKLPSDEYVATMKPLFTRFLQQLMAADLVASAVCESLNAEGILIAMIGAGRTVVKTAVKPDNQQAELAINSMIEILDQGMAKSLQSGVDTVKASEFARTMGLLDE